MDMALEEQYLLANMVVEVIIGEDARIQYNDVFDIVVDIIEGGLISSNSNSNSNSISNSNSNKLEDKLIKKVVNVYNAVLWLGSSIDELSIEKIMQLHRIVGDGIIYNAGFPRLREAKPAGYDFSYVPANRIMMELTALLSWLKDSVLGNVSVEILVKFYIRFLYIHPFSNGNGRVARIIMYWLMDLYVSDCCFVSLYVGMGAIASIGMVSDMEKLQYALVEAQQYGNLTDIMEYVKASIDRNRGLIRYLK